jgi:hypothetical protein
LLVNDPNAPARSIAEHVAYAHTRADAPIADWQRLDEHLTNVATLAAEFADDFQSAPWGELAGR